MAGRWNKEGLYGGNQTVPSGVSCMNPHGARIMIYLLLRSCMEVDEAQRGDESARTELSHVAAMVKERNGEMGREERLGEAPPVQHAPR